MPSQNQIRERITATIVEALKTGGLPPWRKPWATDPNAGFPCNMTGRKYRGINPLLLQIASMRFGFKSKWWGTWNQWQKVGGKVMKRPDTVPPGNGAPRSFSGPRCQDRREQPGRGGGEGHLLMKTFVVFNVEQVVGEGLDVFRIGHSPIQPRTPFVVYEEADRVIEATGADIRYGGNQAFYRPSEDFIQVPLREQFSRRNIMKRSCMSFATGVSPA